MASFKVIIIGCGLAGGLLGNGLINNDVDFVVYERASRHSKLDGYQIRLGENALKGMRACLTKERLDLIVSKFGRADGKRLSAPIVRDRDFNIMMDMNRLPFYTKSAPISRGLLRDMLSDPLFEAGKVHFNKSFTRYEILNPGSAYEKVRVWFSDGTHDDGDVVIAADGVHSKINQQIGLKNVKTLHNYWSCLSKCELPTAKFLTVSKELLEYALVIASNDQTLFFCAYLPDKAIEGDVHESSVDDSLSSLFFAWGTPTEGAPDFGKLSLDEKWDYIGKQVREHWGPKYWEVVDLMQGCDLYTYHPSTSFQPPLGWRAKAQDASAPEKGHPRVMFIGDSMHAMLPSRGMGGAQSMQDTTDLLPILVNLACKAESKEGVSNADVEKACRDYESQMMPRAFDWVRQSGEAPTLPDTSTRLGRLSYYIGSIGIQLTIMYYWFTGLFITYENPQDAPELRG